MPVIHSHDLRQTLNNGRGSVIDFAPAHPRWIRPASLMIGDVTRDLMRAYFAHSLVLPTSLFIVPNAEVIGPELVIIDGEFQHSSELDITTEYVTRRYEDISTAFNRRRKLHIRGEVIFLCGNGYRMYGHWIVDYLPKLYILHASGRRMEKLSFLVPSDLPEFAVALLELMGIEKSQLLFYSPSEDIVSCESLVVPTALRFANRVSTLLPKAQSFIIERMRVDRFGWLPGRRKKTYRKIFIARSENISTLNRRKLKQREEFKTKAAEGGFRIVYPEQLDVLSQIKLFRSADAIFGEYGSGLHGSVFSRRGAIVVAARPNNVELGFAQSAVDEMLDHENGYIIGGPLEADGSFSVHSEDINMSFDWLAWRNYDRAF